MLGSSFATVAKSLCLLRRRTLCAFLAATLEHGLLRRRAVVGVNDVHEL